MTLPGFDPSPAYLVFGATGGIGSALCRCLHLQGARLFLAARDPEKLKALGDELQSPWCSADATKPEQVDACVAMAAEKTGRIDGVAHCVGSILLKSAHSTSDAEWLDTINLNLHSAFYVLRASAKAMLTHGGSLVFVSSAAARIGLVNHEAIAAAKGGVEALVRSAAATYAARSIRVNAVAPGLVDTPLASRIVQNEAAFKASRAMHPLGRIGEPNDVAAAIAWFLSPLQSWITGQTLGVDGGLADLKLRAQ